MMNLKNLLILLFLVIFFAGLFFLREKIFQIIEFRQKNSLDRQKLALITEKVATLEGLDVNELSSKTEILLKALPAEKNISNILLSLKLLVDQTGLEFKGFEVEPGELSTESAQMKEPERENLPFMLFALTINGDYQKLKDFLERVETAFPLMRLQKVSFSSEKEGSSETILDLKAFFLPLPQTLGTIDAPLSLVTPQEENAYRQLSKFTPVLSEEALPTIQSGKENPFAL